MGRPGRESVDGLHYPRHCRRSGGRQCADADRVPGNRLAGRLIVGLLHPPAGRLSWQTAFCSSATPAGSPPGLRVAGGTLCGTGVRTPIGRRFAALRLTAEAPRGRSGRTIGLAVGNFRNEGPHFARRPSYVVLRLFSFACRPRPVACCPSPVARRPSSVVRRLPSVACCLLPVARCLLPVARRQAPVVSAAGTTMPRPDRPSMQTSSGRSKCTCRR